MHGALRRARVHEQAEQYADALKDFEKVLEFDPADISVRETVARYYEDIGDFKEAESTLRTGLVHIKTRARALSLLRDFYHRHARHRSEAAVARLMKCTGHDHAHAALAAVALSQNDPARALTELSATKTQSSVTTRMRVEATLRIQIEALRIASESSTDSAIHFEYAEALRQLDMPELAQSTYLRAGAADPSAFTRASGSGVGPNFFVVGPPRTGTTLVRKLLELHPLVRLLEGEPAFLANAPAQTLSAYVSQVQKLRETLPAKTGIVGDKSPQHFALSDAQVALAATLFPHAKIIITTREPVERVWSEIKLLRRSRVVDASVAAALGGGFIPPWLEDMIDRSRYVTHTKKWIKYFGAERVLLIETEEFERDVMAGCVPLYDFLELEPPPTDHIRDLQRNWSNRTLPYTINPALTALLRAACGTEPYKVLDIRSALSRL